MAVSKRISCNFTESQFQPSECYDALRTFFERRANFVAVLADTIGWRWSFLGQAPLIFIAILLVSWKLPSSASSLTTPPSLPQPQSKPGKSSKLRRIDFIGAFLLATTVVSLLGALSIGGQSFPWSHPIPSSLILLSILFGTIFVFYEVKIPLEPIFPPSLIIRRDIATPCFILGLQTGAQLAMMYSIPLYFRVTQNSSNTTAGAHLFPAVFGNALGGLMAGYIINATGRYKRLLFLSSLSSSLTYLLLYLFWEGNTSWPESLEIIPGGFGMGVAGSATFIALQGSVGREEMAIATGALYLFGGVGNMVGVAGASAIQMGEFCFSPLATSVFFCFM